MPTQSTIQPARKGIFVILALIIAILFSLPDATLFAQEKSKKTLFPATDGAFYYLGRTKRDETTLWTWPGSGLRVGYHGSKTVTVRFLATDHMSEPFNGTTRLIWYKVDRGPWKRLMVGPTAIDREYNLDVPPDGGKHTLDIIKASEGQIAFRGLFLDSGGGLDAVGGYGRRIEFVGDSISTGAKVYGGTTLANPADHDVRGSYSWLLADRMGAEARVIAVTSRGVLHNFNEPPGTNPTLPALYPLLQRNYYNAQNDWGAWQPEIVFVNLGTNDMTPPGDTPAGNFQTAYTNLLAMLRQFNPGAVIVAVQPFGLQSGVVRVYPNEIRAAVADRRAAGDKRVAYVDTIGWLDKTDFTDGVHPNAKGHSKAANRLLSVVRQLDSGVIPGGDALPPASNTANSVAAVPATPTSTTNVVCRRAKPARLVIGGSARVIADKRGPSPVRANPGRGRLVASAAEGTVLKITGGPTCLAPVLYWQVTLPDGRTGWIAEGDGAGYFVEPISG